ncbi:MAG: GNAT family N-acetyltransferase [Candidatus Bathyarchaeota archaeon]|nr:GNAT family N-acetyltransferase [Candidatus Bathyarchaeota archaeon]
MFSVRKLGFEDLGFAVDLANSMNWSMTKEDFKFSLQLEPNGCFLLLHNQKPTGVITCINHNREIGWFGNLVITKENREKGAGTTLVNHAINYLKNAGASTIGLYATEQVTGFYEKLGFKQNGKFAVLHAKTIASTQTTNSTKTRELTEKDLPTVAAFDQRCFGASRRKLLEAMLQRPDAACLGYFEDAMLLGYATAKVSGVVEVGPLVCQKGRRDVTVALLGEVLRRFVGCEAFLYVPLVESAVLDAAIGAGFVEEFGVVRMFLGAAVTGDCVYVAESLERG